MTKKHFIFIGILASFLPFLLRGQEAPKIGAEKTTDTPLNVLSGKVFYDQNKNETFDNEPMLRWWFVQARNTTTGQSYLTATDETGYYQLKLEIGTYKINVITPNRYWLPFQQDTYVYFKLLETEASLDFAMKSGTNSPAMQIDLAESTFRECAENTYTVRFANNGTTVATDAFVNLYLEPSLAFAGSSIPLSSKNGQIYRFDIGNIPVNGYGSFTVKVRTDCDTPTNLVQNMCATAHIFPDTICSGLPIASTRIVSNSRGDIANAIRYNKSHIIIEDVIIFIMPVGDNGQNPLNQIDSSGIKKTTAAFDGDSMYIGQNRLSLQAYQTAFFGDYPQTVNSPFEYRLCHALEVGSNLNTQNQKQGKSSLIEQFSNVVIYPNPMIETATFEIKEGSTNKHQLLIFNTMGKLLRQEYFTGNKLIFHKKDLSSGVYFYKIMKENIPLSMGSIFIAQH